MADSNGGLLSGLETALADWEGVLAAVPFLILGIIVILAWIHFGHQGAIGEVRAQTRG